MSVIFGDDYPSKPRLISLFYSMEFPLNQWDTERQFQYMGAPSASLYAETSSLVQMLCAQQVTSHVKSSIPILILAMLTSCSEEEDVFVPNKIVSAPFTALSIDEVRTYEELEPLPADEVQTYEELESFLRGKYGDIQPLASIWIGSGNSDSGSGPFRFRLSNGSEIAVDGLYSRADGQTVDPNFDLHSLPDAAIN